MEHGMAGHRMARMADRTHTFFSGPLYVAVPLLPLPGDADNAAAGTAMPWPARFRLLERPRPWASLVEEQARQHVRRPNPPITALSHYQF